MPLCNECSRLNLRALFTDNKTSNQHPIQQWTLSLLRESARACDLCCLLFKIVTFRNLPFSQVQNTLATCKLYLEDFGEILSQKSGAIIPPGGIARYGSEVEPVPRLSLRVETDNGHAAALPHGLQIKARDSGEVGRSSFLRGRVLGPQVDIQLLSKWIKICSEKHGTICTPAEMDKGIKELTIRVIDVSRLCIVELPRDAKYVALSYVWGSNQQLRLLRENYKDFTRDLALHRHAESIPNTISNAMNLVKQLGEIFLWVDALCIIQDDPADVSVQIQNMNVVYGCAALTVVAAAGSDSNSGLPGLLPNSRELLVLDREIQGVPLITSLPDFAHSVHESTWETRGWTMQEKVLSKRLLIFTRHQVFYHCNCATWCEDSIWESEDPYIQLAPGMGAISPHLLRCALPPHSSTGLRKYSHLVTGYHSRQLSHQSDAMNAFTGALTALGKELKTPFIWGLPESAFDDTLFWRSAIHDHNLRREQFPSWTWPGWKASPLIGDLEFPVTRAAHVETVPLVKWHCITDKGENQPIGNSPAPYYPLPKFESLSSKIPLDHFIHFWTTSALLFVGREPQPTPPIHFSEYNCYYYLVGIRDASGEIKGFGTISLNKEWRQAQPDLLEFILICRRRTRNLYNDGIYDMLELMLVETKESVSYRVQMIYSPVDENWWSYAVPVWKVVALG